MKRLLLVAIILCLVASPSANAENTFSFNLSIDVDCGKENVFHKRIATVPIKPTGIFFNTMNTVQLGMELDLGQIGLEPREIVLTPTDDGVVRIFLPYADFEIPFGHIRKDESFCNPNLDWINGPLNLPLMIHHRNTAPIHFSAEDSVQLSYELNDECIKNDNPPYGVPIKGTVWSRKGIALIKIAADMNQKPVEISHNVSFYFENMRGCKSATASKSVEIFPLGSVSVKGILVAQSILSYSGDCQCPYTKMNDGRQCGTSSAHSKSGGTEPLCYIGNVTDEMVERYRKSLQ